MTLVGSTHPSTTSEGSDEEIVDVAEEYLTRMKKSAHAAKPRPGTGKKSKRSSRPPTLQASRAGPPQARAFVEARKLLERLSEVIAQENRVSANTSKIPVEINPLPRKLSRAGQVRSRSEKSCWLPTIMSKFWTRSAKRPPWRKLPNSRRRLAELRTAEGRRLRINIIKRLPPTGANVEYLLAPAVYVWGRRHLSRGPAQGLPG